jgi:hypothetical protein
MKLVQYWDTGSPPDEVAGWIEGFRRHNPQMTHRLHDRDSASWFIGKRIGEREKRAFDACAVPAMQADYFRLCALVAEAGVYSDADFECRRPLDQLLSQAPAALAFVWGTMMTQGFWFVRRRDDPFLRACLKLATENIEQRRFGNVYLSTGPALINAVRIAVDPAWSEMAKVRWPAWPRLVAAARESLADPEGVLASIQALTLMHYFAVSKWIGTPKPAYKDTGVHWFGWKGSIYNDLAPEPAGPGHSKS